MNFKFCLTRVSAKIISVSKSPAFDFYLKDECPTRINKVLTYCDQFRVLVLTLLNPFNFTQ